MMSFIDFFYRFKELWIGIKNTSILNKGKYTQSAFFDRKGLRIYTLIRVYFLDI